MPYCYVIKIHGYLAKPNSMTQSINLQIIYFFLCIQTHTHALKDNKEQKFQELSQLYSLKGQSLKVFLLNQFSMWYATDRPIRRKMSINSYKILCLYFPAI